MLFKSKFNIGQEVVKIIQRKETDEIPCEYCTGSGKIRANNGVALRCDNCRGIGSNTVYKDLAWAIFEFPLTIGEIKIRHGVVDEEVYMASETGLGSGMNHRVADLFLTPALAQKECDIRNRGVEDAG